MQRLKIDYRAIAKRASENAESEEKIDRPLLLMIFSRRQKSSG